MTSFLLKNTALPALLFSWLSLTAGAAPQLGPPLRLSDAEVERHTSVARAAADGAVAGFTVDTANRNDVLSLYHRVYRASERFADTHGWTGDVDQCLPGTSSNDLKEDTRRRVNYYRAMAGLDATISFDDQKSRKAQDAALIMSRQGGLSHNPNQDFPGNACLSADGQDAASSSNLSLGNYGPNAVRGQMNDDGSNNGVVGHRRWILYSRAAEMGTGDIPDGPGRWASNSLWVIGNFAAAPSPAPEIAWPPAGFVPHDLAPNDSLSFPRWSYGYPGADFSQATVTMMQGETVIGLVHEAVQANVGDNTLAWRPSGIPGTPPAVDTTYTVTISGIANAPFTQRTYEVTLIDPFALNAELLLTGNAAPPTGVTSTYTFTGVDGADAYDVSIASYSDQPWTEGAEGTPTVIDGTAASYSLVGNHSVASGAQAFHLATPDFGSAEHVVIDRQLLPQADSQIQLRYRRLFMHPDTKLRVQLSSDSGQSYTTVHSIDGNNFGSSAQWDPASFLSQTVDIPSDFHGRLTSLRFMLDNTGVAFIGTTATTGMYIDDITVQNGLEIDSQTSLSLAAETTSFDHIPTSVGEQRLLMAGLRLGGRFWGYGPALAVESVSALAVAGLSPTAGTTDVPSNTNLVATFSETVTKGTGTVALRRVDDGALLGSVDVASGAITIAGPVVTIDLPFQLPNTSEVEVEFAAGIFQNAAGGSFADFGGQGPWRFTTAAPAVPGIILSLSPADDAIDVGAAGSFTPVITFDKEMRSGSGEIRVFRAADDSPLGSVNVQSPDVHVVGTTATIGAPFPLAINTAYYITFPAGAFVDFDGIDAPGIVSPTAWNFDVSSLEFVLRLERGWSLVSLPIQPETTSLDLFVGSGRVFTLQDGLLVPATELQPKCGYFVFNPRGPRSVSVIGQPVADAVTSVPTGWSLLGTVSSPPYLPRSFAEALGTTPTFAWKLERGVYRDATVLEPGAGYWVWAGP
jgi:hypothetical protein